MKDQKIVYNIVKAKSAGKCKLKEKIILTEREQIISDEEKVAISHDIATNVNAYASVNHNRRCLC